MNWYSRIFNFYGIKNKEETVKQQNRPKNNLDDVVLEGLSSSNKIVQDVYKIQRGWLIEWRERYSKEEYPYKVVRNLIYQLLQLEYMWDTLHLYFSTNTRKFNDYNLAYNYVMKLKEVAILNISTKLDYTYNNRNLIGNFDLKLFRKMVTEAQKGNNEQIEKIEKSYLWYTGGVELIYHWAACGLMGLNYAQAASEVCSMFMGIDYKNLSDMQTMFGNNINMEYKALPEYFSINLYNEGRAKQASEEKQCEYCGKSTKNYLFGIVVIPTYKFNLEHPDIDYNDSVNNIIKLRNSEEIHYSLQIDNKHAVIFNDAQTHIFCSDTCIYEFSNGYKIYYNSQANMLSENFLKDSLYLPEVLNPNKIKIVESSSCDNCNEIFPNASKEYLISKILKYDKINGSLNSAIPELSNYDVAHSDINPKKPTGNWYCYSLDNDNIKRAKFCSNDCALDYSKKHNCYIDFKSNFQGIYLAVVTPQLEEINKSLSNSYLKRPIKHQVVLDDINENLKNNNITSYNPFVESKDIRFLNGELSLVEWKIDGIWMKPVKEFNIEKEIFIAFSPENRIQFPSFKNGIPCLNKLAIQQSHEFSQRTFYEIDNYIYPAFDIYKNNKENDENRLTDEIKIQIYHLVSFIINQYFIFRETLNGYTKIDIITLNQLLASVVYLLYKKDSKFERKKMYYNTKFYLQPIEDEFIDKIIQKAQLDFHTLKINNQGVFQPHGSRDEEELILSYVDVIVLREFFMNYLINQIEITSYTDFVPVVVEELFQEIVKTNLEKKFPDIFDDNVPF